MQEEISFREWLRQQRRALDLSRQALADQVGCAEVTLRRIEGGTLKPSRELANILLEKIGIPEMERPQWISFARGLSGFPSESITPSHKPITNLPSPLTTFIGRETEQADVTRLIAKHRLVTLTGPGGVGKTRLSLKVCEQVLKDYPEGVWLVEFAPILDPLLVPRITASAIGLRDEPQRPVIDMLSDYLREKQMLIMLDNCEHLLDACAQLADTLLKRCPSLKILATSREALRILGEAIYPVPSLQLPGIQQLLEKFRDYESVRLFEERAQLARMNFSLTIDNAFSVAEICRRLDGIPLAIELAAARISTFSAEQIAARLQESFNLLTIGNRTALPRHQTLQAAIDWSHDLLSPAEQTLFRRLSVFVNGWMLEAAESICSGANIKSEEILDLLTRLIDRSLVVAQEEQGKTRYRMLETIRQYANEKLIDVGEDEALRDMHLDYFLKLAEAAEPHLIRPEQLEWLPLLDVDYENLRHAFEWSLSKEAAELSLRLCAALGMFWYIRSYFLEGSKWLKSALSRSSQSSGADEMAVRARALYQDAHLAVMMDEIERSRTSAELSLALASGGTDRRDIAIARFYVALASDWRSEGNVASHLITQSLAEFRELNDAYWEAFSFRYHNYLLAHQGKLKRREGCLPTLELARKAGERLNLADALWDYSSLFSDSNQIDERIKYVEEADMLYKQIGSGFNWTSMAFAEKAWLKGNYKEARATFTEMQERLGLLGEKNSRSVVVANLGLLEAEEGNFVQAYTYLEEALVTARALGNQDFIALRLIQLGNVHYLEGKIEQFKRNYRESYFLVKDFDPFTKAYFLYFVLDPIASQKPENAAWILGAIDNFERENDPIPPPLKRYYRSAETHALNRLGDAAFEFAFAEGQRMSLDEALDLALKTVEEM